MRCKFTWDMMVREPVDISSDDEKSSNQHSNYDKSLLRYKHRYGHIELHKQCLSCLNTGQYLKDNIVQFYLAYLLTERCSDENADRTHIFDTIFYQDIDKVFRDKVDREKLQESRKWYRDVNIFNKDFLIIPICKDDHWKVAVICYPGAVRPVDFNDLDDNSNIKKKQNGHSEKKPDCQEIPSIIIMDSLGLKASGVSRKLRDFLDYEWRRNMSSNKPVKRFSYDDMRDYTPKLPHQKNTYDCGLYMLVYIKCFLKEPDQVYELMRSEDENQRLQGIVAGNLGRTTRESIKKLIFDKTSVNDNQNDN